MKINEFSHNDTNVIKGFAILCIVLHNLFRWINPYTGENEFTFSSSYIYNLINGIIANPLDTINLLFSYFGHYGVQLFIFISGYGLAISMSNKKTKWLPFIIERLKKIYPLLFVGILFYFLGKTLIYKDFTSAFELKHFILRLLFLQTISLDYAMAISGPWWFFSLIMQLYIIFPFLFRIIRRYQIKALIIILALSYILLYIVQTYFISMQETAQINFIGHIPEFSLGVWFALNKDKIISNYYVVIAVVIFVLANFYQMFFPLSFLCITFILIFIFNRILRKKRENIIIKFFAYYGSISMAIFAIHSIYRDPYIEIASNYSSPLITLVLALIFLILITILSIPAKNIYLYIVSKLNRKNN